MPQILTLKRNTPVIYTNKAYCRDCNRCVRVCPVKAIRMHAGQASVVDDRCIACGTCVRECPQRAKTYRKDVDAARQLIQTHPVTVCSLAPSFAGFFPVWQRKRLPSALRRLGFSFIGETAVGAYYSALATAEYVKKHPKEPSICTACPAVVEYVQKYRPKAARYLVPVVSPMVAHAIHLREKLGRETAVVFVGPCIAKKSEAGHYYGDARVDCVLTFEELLQWFENEQIDVSGCEESDFDETPKGKSRLFPLEGGCVLTGGLMTEFLDADCIPVSGYRNVEHAILESRAGQVIEPLFCPLGCAGGPAGDGTNGCFEVRTGIINYAREEEHSVPGDSLKTEEPDGNEKAFLSKLTVFYDKAVSPIVRSEISEAAIRHVLEMTGKALQENQLNCGACGYPTCREKAVAVIEGLAEPEMCLPFVRRIAEQRVDRIIETSPNGIVILDEHLNILSMNPAFRTLFRCSNAICGKPVSHLLDPEPFERLMGNPKNVINRTLGYPSYNLECHVLFYALPEEKQYVGIFVDITDAKINMTKLDKLRYQTVTQARELLEQQIQMAETIAICLGENAARAESLLENLMNQANTENA
ncbi:MAG: 4Fe-4S binding protein [Planctomycetaceae bacterium]|jgi:Na+-translocating ferredoxin:NAD+ oxidoreductase RNF subunit RnfB|nr:4Fe-4S binding protein [Planctomycetaceae bacterium]